ncbi:hypothetical protein [Aliagarivorans taiwanensis]|uniref:hypothetical protein n=1 Tax=Aliagarivorans taiwanensis TaxID=561966 RepID=UPI000409104B|nr:hypothetical protein [Aliagarivorans taiwanensis]
MEFEITEIATRTITVAPCIKCGCDEISIFDYGYSAPNIGGGKCTGCGHEVSSSCAISPKKEDLAQKWNDANDVATVLAKKESQMKELEAEIAELKNKLSVKD